ncbi:MAG: NADH-quinone oxidoreductase subunit A [Chloroflexota bacterium]
MTQFGHVGLFLIVVVLFAASLPIIAFFIRLFGMVPIKPNPTKMAPYESGMVTVGKSWLQFNFRYYTYALLFVALDVTAVLLFAWGVNLKVLGTFGLVTALVFIAILAVGYLYAWRKRTLEWK